MTQLNTILLQNLEARLIGESDATPLALNERFQVRGERLEACTEDLFEREPRAILESFVLLQQHQELRGMTAATLRALWRARPRVDARLRRDPVARLLFLHFLQQPRGIVHEFRRMNQYGILGRYLPVFGRIVGQMQHDLFHVYTVDQHILMVVRNLRRFTMPEHAHEYPAVQPADDGFERPWLLYVAALFHDIAKGRGGDHSELGARDVRALLPRATASSRDDAALVEFLVEHHLTMSPDRAEAGPARSRGDRAPSPTLVGSERRLTALYLLTVADIRGTSPKVWNAWKAKLLEDLFRAARRVLAGDAPALDAALADKQEEAARLLRLYALSDDVKERFWAQLDTPYFLRHDAQRDRLARRALCTTASTPRRRWSRRASRPIGEGLQVHDLRARPRILFARICGYFDRAGFNIARGQDPHDAPRLRARHLPGHGPGSRRALPRHAAADREGTCGRARLARAAAAAPGRAPVAARAAFSGVAGGGPAP